MSRLEPAETIERAVGAKRHPTEHLGRAVSSEQRVYVLHSAECVASGIDLRACDYSLALDLGIDTANWADAEDRPVVLRIDPVWEDLLPARDAAGLIIPSASIAAFIVDVLQSTTLQYITEDDLQAAITTALGSAGVPADREVRLSDGVSRIDLLVGDVGIEVKIGGAAPSVIRQLARYAKCAEISTLILITTRARHSASLDRIETLIDKPLLVCSLIGAGL